MTNIFENPARMPPDPSKDVEPQLKVDVAGFHKFSHHVHHVPAPVIGKKV